MISGQIEKPITKGNFLTGGTLSLDFKQIKEYMPIISTQQQELTTSNVLTFETDLYFGYFVLNHFALGLKTDIQIINDKRTKQDFHYELSSHNLSFGPFFRYYTELGIFIETSSSVYFLMGKYSNNVSEWKSFSFDAGVGYSLFVSKSVAIEPEIKYMYSYTPDIEDIENSKELINGFNLTVGLQVYLDLITDK